MRPMIMILAMCLMPAARGFCAEDSGERTYPVDDRAACMERDIDTARGGCVTRQDGSPRAAAPQALPPEADTTRQSPPESAAADRAELPLPGSDTR